MTNNEDNKILIIKKLIDNFSLMISYWDCNLKNKFCNKAYLETFIHEADPHDKYLYELLPEEYFNSLKEYIDGVLEGKDQYFERSYKLKNGEIRFYEVTYFADKEGDQVIGYYSLLNDITNFKTIIREKEEISEKLIQSSKMIALGEMAGGIAHEINNPLSIIIMNSGFVQDLLQEKEIKVDQISKFVSKIQATSVRIEKIITGLRFFSQERISDPFAIVNLSSIIDDTLAFCVEKFKAKKISFVYSSVDSDVLIECHPVQISQVLLNVLNNAADAVENCEKKWISLLVKDHGDCISMSIIDSGPGIPEDLRLKIMDPFVSTKEVGKGTGLGLSISKGIMDTHHGKIELDPNASNTTFVLTLPKKQINGSGFSS